MVEERSDTSYTQLILAQAELSLEAVRVNKTSSMVATKVASSKSAGNWLDGLESTHTSAVALSARWNGKWSVGHVVVKALSVTGWVGTADDDNLGGVAWANLEGTRSILRPIAASAWCWGGSILGGGWGDGGFDRCSGSSRDPQECGLRWCDLGCCLSLNWLRNGSFGWATDIGEGGSNHNIADTDGWATDESRLSDNRRWLRSRGWNCL